MFALRIGQTEEGVRQYRRAISYFKRSENLTGEALARAYFAFESARARLPDAEATFNEAKEFSRNIQYVPDVKVVLGRAEALVGAIKHRNSPAEV
jgi:hypothetical protein